MPSKKKSKKKSASRPAKKARRPATKGRVAKKSAKKKPAQKRTASRSKPKTRKKAIVSAEAELKREFGRRNRTGIVLPARLPDFEGSSRAEQADSESVDELVEEGNLFEAGAVAGVEEADNADEKEVQTHELLEDDVPEEYLDKE